MFNLNFKPQSCREALGAEAADGLYEVPPLSFNPLSLRSLFLLGATHANSQFLGGYCLSERIVLSGAVIDLKEEKPFLVEVWCEGKKQRIEVSEPPDIGGLADRWSPLDLLSASLGACEVATAVTVARKIGVELGGLKVDVRAEWHLPGGGLRRVTVKVSGYKDRDSIEKVWKHVERICPVLQVLKKAGVEIVTVFE